MSVLSFSGAGGSECDGANEMEGDWAGPLPVTGSMTVGQGQSGGMPICDTRCKT